MIPALHGNWVDLAILAILIYMVSDSWKTGFWILISNFLGFLLSLFVALRGYPFVGRILENNFTLPHSVANALGFLLNIRVNGKEIGKTVEPVYS